MGLLSSTRNASRADLVSLEFCEEVSHMWPYVWCWTGTGFDTDSKVKFGSGSFKISLKLGLSAKFLDREFALDSSSRTKVEVKEMFNEPQITTQQFDNSILEPQVTQASRRSRRVIQPPQRYGLLHDIIGELHLLGDNEEKDGPFNYTEAMSDIDSKKWQEAMKSKMDSMYANQVWTLVDPPQGIVPIENKWIFQRKIGSNGKMETYKARLVAKGYKQREGTDYEETFSYS
ncbi:hypothetical protein L3X38_037155 [Prunus dulcis]|uniref:Reverse transcriptase Ty1/copia-type domain-containing protein n=1 Tax=Prunus dulcis TaxID=3755 RepID=A0AAD4V356_PRUDU|nr:hypothetical protein L3X38_037155 [Prunus dulcis]